MTEVDLRMPGSPFSLSFAGGGYLVVYEIGVVQSLLEQAPEIVRSASKVYGASAGSLIAASVVCECCLDDLKMNFYTIAQDVRRSILGPLTHGYSIIRTIQKHLYQSMPENSHQMATGRLFISLTRAADGQNVIVSEYSSKEELIQALICSCFVPIYFGFIPPSFRGVRYVDGGFSSLQPYSDLETVITVSPFTGEIDICPRDCPAIFYSVNVNTSLHISMENLGRLWHAFSPPSCQDLQNIYLQGYQDAIVFLHRNTLGVLHTKKRYGLLNSITEFMSKHLISFGKSIEQLWYFWRKSAEDRTSKEGSSNRKCKAKLQAGINEK
ncbi:PREDICTED: patatin-like phospholipase domain-containing protein 1 isoform X2 [Gekko japonicus]|uniref:Patatin-like phospholipase domain-containing protein 1 isoform X2 n=1 Tax=Gekko japonicus TaxID=146911 RepID=A0ABM1K0U1_GEKJA|nr:PREDICTED: patatin-like phospholipase domain-containing protein 1 isoform X2 [Gekko japonicus]